MGPSCGPSLCDGIDCPVLIWKLEIGIGQKDGCNLEIAEKAHISCRPSGLCIILFKCIFIFVIYFIAVGEEDEVSIKEVAEMIVEAMNFTGKVHVSFY